jgi:hypothetical protein
MFPIGHVTVTTANAQLPALFVDETYVTSVVGNGSVTVTPVAAVGPLFFTTNV